MVGPAHSVPKPHYSNIGISMVKNEEDIIEAFVRNNLRFLDFLLVIENNATDSTPLILEKLKEEGLPIEVVKEPALAFQQSEKITEWYHNLSERMDFTLVFFLDADELLEGDPAALNRSRAEPGLPVKLSEIRYIPERMAGAGKDVLKNLRYALPDLVEGPLNKFMLFHDPKRYRDYMIEDGNHNVQYKNEVLPAGRFPPVRIAHMPLRGRDQIYSKYVIGTLGLLMRSLYDDITGHHWHRKFKEFMEKDFSFSDDELYRLLWGKSREELLATCAYRPLPEQELRYLDLVGCESLLKKVLKTSLNTVHEYWDQKIEVIRLTKRLEEKGINK